MTLASGPYSARSLAVSGFLGFVTGGPAVALGLGGLSPEPRPAPAPIAVAAPVPPVITSGTFTLLAPSAGPDADWLRSLTYEPMLFQDSGGPRSAIFETIAHSGASDVYLTVSPEATFAEGNRVLPDDVCARLDAAQSPAIETCTADEYGVRVHFVGAIALEALEIPIATGPYTCQIESTLTVCRASRAYFHRPKFEKIVIEHGATGGLGVASVGPAARIDREFGMGLLESLDRHRLTAVVCPRGNCSESLSLRAATRFDPAAHPRAIRVYVDPSIPNPVATEAAIGEQLEEMGLDSYAADDPTEADLVVRSDVDVEADERLLWSSNRYDAATSWLPVALDRRPSEPVALVAGP